MSETKKRLLTLIEAQPDDASYEDILRELVFDRMVDRGLADSRHGRVIDDHEMERRIRTWSK